MLACPRGILSRRSCVGDIFGRRGCPRISFNILLKKHEKNSLFLFVFLIPALKHCLTERAFFHKQIAKCVR